MLVALESYFHDALRPAVPDAVEISTGPSLGPVAEAESLVEVCVSQLKLEPLPGLDLAAQREAAYFAQVHRWASDGKKVDFELPAKALGQVAEVESPPGRPLRRGDDYVVDGRTVRFYQPPALADVAVVVFLRGARSAGFLERRRCELSLVIRAWARQSGAADPLLSAALAAALVASADLGNLDDSYASPADSGVRLRLLRPVMSLSGIHRSAETVAETPFFRAEAEFLIRGDLEQLVALGEPEAEGIIREVRKA
ncbi:hypothetical protein [Corallococcus silvisoli]|uniref:hypothetical protein n=1 Tax=Corallococcus silvisoli TaxID=2697031 RepID=UPI001377BF52|nr:hypothetical protein [Corallococcus silvisoli]NBD08296.1 hypothetical protein [Corallococcus silvisoli]